LRDLELAREKKPSSQVPEQQARRWIAPPARSVKINVDAAVRKRQNFGAVAAICRTEDGQYLGASAVVVQCIADPATLEALAYREALALTRDLQQAKVHVATDCLEVIRSMSNKNLG
jgi:ribonuclease HI